MEARIDPLTGGIVFASNDFSNSQIQDLQQQIKKIGDKPQKKYNDINKNFAPQPSLLTPEQKFNKIMSYAEECIQPDELKQLLATKQFPVVYDGFEPSGRMHIAQGILRAINVNKLVDAGFIFIFWIADWFALLNNKMGGDLEKIQNVGRYFVETWKAAGMKMHNVKFLWASEEINKQPDKYWIGVMNIARVFNVTRIMRCSQIMGREESTEQPVAQMFYPCMQCNDIFYLNADMCSLGLDQRKVNMLAREYCDQNKNFKKPIIVSHHMLSGLKEGQQKMSKSDPDSAIFMQDTAADVNRKIKDAYCPEKKVEGNPILDYTKNIIFGAREIFTINRSEKNGGDVTYKSYQDLEKDFVTGNLHPGDLKPAVAKLLNDLIEPVRQHFLNDPDARALLKTIQSYKITK